MGIDARIYVKGARPFDPVSEFSVGVGEYLSPDGWRGTAFTGVDEDGTPWIEGYERLFAPDYPRGNWPKIRQALVFVQDCFPTGEYTILYGSDHDVSWADAWPVTDALLAEFDAAWAALVATGERDPDG